MATGLSAWAAASARDAELSSLDRAVEGFSPAPDQGERRPAPGRRSLGIKDFRRNSWEPITPGSVSSVEFNCRTIGRCREMRCAPSLNGKALAVPAET